MVGEVARALREHDRGFVRVVHDEHEDGGGSRGLRGMGLLALEVVRGIEGLQRRQRREAREDFFAKPGSDYDAGAMILYDYFRSSAAFRVRIALNVKGLSAERRFIHLRKGEQRAASYLETNPQGLVPTLVVGDRPLTQSIAIIEYLDEKHPLPPLLPAGHEDRAWVRSVALAIACDIHPVNNLRVMQYLEGELHVDTPAREAWYAHWIRVGFDALEPQLAARAASGPFCLGDSPTLADICLVPQVANALRFKVPIDAYPRIRAINDACLALPAFSLAHPSRQPDAE
jgi:maleylpyruvate isomerase